MVITELGTKVTISAAVLSVISFSTMSLAGAGDLDPAFDGDGRAHTTFTDLGYDRARIEALAVQSDGRIVAAGVAEVFGVGTDFALARYNADGSLDSSFGGDGRVVTDFSGTFEEIANAIAIQTDGRIVAVGRTTFPWLPAEPLSDFAIARYNSDGTLDATFGVGGRVVTDVGGAGDVAHDVAILSDGKILVVGQRRLVGGGPGEIVVVRYNVDGSLDSNFGTSGIVVKSYAPGIGADARGMAIQGDGKIVVAGHSGQSPGADFAVMRLHPDGTLDASFGIGGVTTTDFAGTAFVFDVALQPDGKIVLAGHTVGGRDFAVARYNADGSLDTAFGSSGLVITDFGEEVSERGRALAVQTDSKIVVVGESATGEGPILGQHTDFAVARYNADGSLDAGFGSFPVNCTGGLVTTTFGVDPVTGDPLFEQASAVAIQADGRIVVAGQAGPFGGSGNPTFALARYDDVTTTPLITVCTPGAGTGTVVYSNTQIQSSSNIDVVAGAGGQEIGDDLHMLRGGSLSSFEFSFRPCDTPGPLDAVVTFYKNDPNDAFHHPGHVEVLPATVCNVALTVPNLPANTSDTNCDTVVTTCVELNSPIELPQDVWMTVTVFSGSMRFPLSRGNQLGTSHEILYFNPALSGTNFIDTGSLGSSLASANLVLTVRMAPDPSDTPEGMNVVVGPEPGMTLTFNNVTQAGATTVTTSTTNPGPGISGFEFLGVFYDIDTNALFNNTVEVCLDYDDAGLSAAQEAALQLLHFDGAVWDDITTDLDTINNVICGTTNSFSAFAIGHPVPSATQALLSALIAKVAALNINHGIINSLDAKLDAAAASLDDFNVNNDTAATMNLNAFINAVEAQNGNHIPVEDADELIQDALNILLSL